MVGMFRPSSQKEASQITLVFKVNTYIKNMGSTYNGKQINST